MLREHHPIAWAYHHGTMRWPFNTLDLPDDEWAGDPFKEHPNTALVALPAPGSVSASLSDAIHARVCCRCFSDAPLEQSELGTILSLGYGVQGAVHLGAKEHLERPVPSGGGLYPLELYVIARVVQGVEPGLYHYAPLHHALEHLTSVTLSNALISQIFMNQPYLANAAAIVVTTAVVERLLHKYGDRGYRYVLFEAGHVAQNMCLVCAGLPLGALPVGGFFDGYLGELLGLDLESEPILYALGLGHPSTADRVAVRNLEALLGG